MKLLRIAAWTAWFMLSWMTLAYAGPVVAAIGAVAGWLASGTVLANLALGFLFTAVKVGLSLLFKAKQPSTKPAGVSAETKFGGDNPLSFIMGAFAGGGQLEYANSYGKVNDTPNAYLVHVISLADLPMGLSGLWIDDKKVTLPDMSGAMPDEKGYIVEEFRNPKGSHSPFVWIRYHDGSQTEADAYLRATFGADADRPFLADMIFRGVPYIVVTSRFSTELFNGIPQFLFETGGIRLYDPRKDTTVGGSGSHRWNDVSTWEPSSNNAVQIYNILRGIYYEGEWIWGGQCEAWQLPLSNWFAAMNACNLPIDLAGGGTEPQFRNGCEISTDHEPLDVINDILKGCNGRMAEIGGIYKLSIGAPGAAVYSFTDETIVVTEGQSLDPFPGLEQTFNGAQASYPEPAEKWAAKDAPAYLRTDLEVLDDNRRLVTGIQYPYTPYAVQVQRLLQAAVNDARRFKVHSFVLPPEAMVLEPNDVVAWTSARNGYVEKKFIIVSIEGDSNLLQYVTIKEIDPADFSWNPATDQQSYSVAPLGDIIPAAQVIVGWQVFPAAFQDSAGAPRRPSIEVRFPGDLDDVEYVRVQVRLAPDESIVFDAVLPYGDPLTNDNPLSVILNGTFLPDTDYEVRGLLEPFSDRLTDWTGWLPVTTDDIRLGGDDLFPIDLAQLQQDVYQTVLGLRQEAEDLRARLEQVAVSASDIATRVVETDTLRVESDRATARVFEGIDASIEQIDDTLVVQATRIDGVETSVTTIQEDLGDLGGDVGAIGSQVAANSGAIAGLESTTVQQGMDIATNAAAIQTVESNLEAVSTDLDGLETTVAGNSSAISTLQTASTQHGDDIASNAAAITSLGSEVTDQAAGIAANAAATTALTTQVGVIDGQVEALSDSVNSVEAAVGDATASGLFRIVAVAGSGDVTVRQVAQVRATTGDAWVEAGYFVEAGFVGGDPLQPFSRYVINVDQFVVTDGTDSGSPLVFQDGEMLLKVARIEEIIAGVLRNDDSTFIQTIEDGSIEWFDP